MTGPQVLDPLVVVVPSLTVLASVMVVAGLDTACETSLAAEEAVCKGCISVFVAVKDTQASCYLTAFLLRWVVDHIQGDCVTKTAAVEASEIEQQ